MKSYIFTFPWILNLHLYLEPEAPGSSYGRGVWRWWQGQIKKIGTKIGFVFQRSKKKRDRFSFMYYYLYPWSPPRSGRLRLKISAKVRKSKFVLFFVEGHQLLNLRQTNSMTEIRFQPTKIESFSFSSKTCKKLDVANSVRKTSCGLYTKRL